LDEIAVIARAHESVRYALQHLEHVAGELGGAAAKRKARQSEA
jgi:hypothetical protein